jgi:hypothetical protein
MAKIIIFINNIARRWRFIGRIIFQFAKIGRIIFQFAKIGRIIFQFAKIGRKTIKIIYSNLQRLGENFFPNNEVNNFLFF